MKRVHNSLLIICVALACLQATSCTYPGRPIRYTGTIHDTKSLPHFLVDSDMRFDGPMGRSTWTIGNTVKINSGQKMDSLGQRLQFFKYRSLFQEADGDTYWEISWQERGQKIQKKVIKYSGKAIYAVNKKGLKIGLIPPKKGDERTDSSKVD